jgi:hypothetical protein
MYMSRGDRADQCGVVEKLLPETLQEKGMRRSRGVHESSESLDCSVDTPSVVYVC